MIVLGIDPGSRVTGYGLIEKKDERLICIDSGQIRSSAKSPFHQRIYHIFQSLVDIMTLHGPDEMAVEDLFFAKNPKSALKLGHARGAALVAAAHCGVRIFEYTPLQIKQSVVGYGRATKEQVQSMVRVILQVTSPLSLDTSDALAAAICHLNWTRYETPGDPR